MYIVYTHNNKVDNEQTTTVTKMPQIIIILLALFLSGW